MADSCTVLVVEDEPLIRMDLVDRLSRLGCAALEAGSAAEAIAILEQHREIAALFTDVQMPGAMDGIELAQYVRKRWPPTIIVVSSGKGPPAAGELAPAIPVLAKPYNEGTLRLVVGEVRARASAM